jgi:uncharacterized alpha/beta hydrolase family protein
MTDVIKFRGKITKADYQQYYTQRDLSVTPLPADIDTDTDADSEIKLAGAFGLPDIVKQHAFAVISDVKAGRCSISNALKAAQVIQYNIMLHFVESAFRKGLLDKDYAELVEALHQTKTQPDFERIEHAR